MKRHICVTAAIVCAMFLFNAPLYASEPITIGFEELGPVGADIPLPTDYLGLSWDPHWYYYDWLQFPLDPVASGPVRIFGGHWIDFGRDVTFLGAWVGTFAWGGDKYWLGYNDGQLVYESPHLSANTINQGWIDVYWENVDYVVFVGDHGSYVVDDIAYIPEPCTVLLLGLGGLVLRRQRRR